MMEYKNEEDKVSILAAILGAVIFVMVYGINVLNPLYDDWLMTRMDLSQHYLGWCFFRKSIWSFPLGLTDNLAYPIKTSVIFTDSIPIFAVFFKLLSPILPDTFQYFGLWGIMCFMLQGYFSSKILRELSIGTIQTLIGSIFFILSPTVIEKMFRHTALGGHWIILVAIYMFVRHGKDYENILKTSVVWGIIGFLIAGIHLYYLPMCGMFLFGYILCSLIKVKSNRFKCMLPGFSFLVNLLINTYILGGFSTPNSATADGLGECSFNLNGFFNAKGYSRVFDSLPTYFDSQYEGFSYLGLGIFVLILISMLSAVICVAKSKINLTKGFELYGVVYILMSLGLILFAASPIVTWNDKLLFEYPYSSTLYHYWSIFRSTGRMIWPVCYLIYIAVIVGNSKMWEIINAKESVATIVLGACLVLQMFDLSGKISEQRDNFDSVSYQSTLQSDVWTKLSQFDTIEHVVWVSNHYENNDMLQLARYADVNNWTMNNFYFARGLSVLEYTKDAMQNLNDKCVYVFNQDEPTDYEGLYLYEADGYVVGTTFPLY